MLCSNLPRQLLRTTKPARTGGRLSPLLSAGAWSALDSAASNVTAPFVLGIRVWAKLGGRGIIGQSTSYVQYLSRAL